MTSKAPLEVAADPALFALILSSISLLSVSVQKMGFPFSVFFVGKRAFPLLLTVSADTPKVFRLHAHADADSKDCVSGTAEGRYARFQ